MENQFFRSQASVLNARLRANATRIQVLFGPRQVGKTSLAKQVIKQLSWPTHFATADAVGTATTTWLASQWEEARLLERLAPNTPVLLVLDEIQKIPNWSEYVKKLWDEDRSENSQIRVVILGSSPLLMQKGLSESLAGRFEIIPVVHWTFSEMHQAFGWSVEDYILFGGYPGAHDLIADVDRWSRYILDSLVETTLSRDIFLMTRVDKPALFRQLFELGCMASGQILSFQKIMGQLQEAGNASTLSGYLQLMESAGLLAGLPKFAGSAPRRKASSPKFQVFNNALLTAWRGVGIARIRSEPETWGRLVESAVGCHLLNAARTEGIKVSYWNEGQHEIDFIVEWQGEVVAIEVKSGRRTAKLSAAASFAKVMPQAKFLTIGQGGLPIEDFLAMNPRKIFSNS